MPLHQQLIRRIVNKPPRIFRLLLIAPVLFAMACGHMGRSPGRDACPVVMGKWPARPWADAIAYQTPHYFIRTNTSHSTAQAIGKLMEQALPLYCDLLGCQPDNLPTLIINAYADEKEYNTVAKQLGLPPHITTGLYSPLPPAAIHLPCDSRHDTCRTLLHEGLHQVADSVMRFSVPAAAAKILSPARRYLTGLPLWLNEGLATYMEGALTPKGDIVPGTINHTRLTELQKLIRKNQCPSLETVLSKTYGDPLSSRDYAVFWGLVYFLRHGPEPAGKLQQYLQACRRGFYARAYPDFFRDFLPDGRPVENFDRRWAEHLGARSLQTFHKIFSDPQKPCDAFEADFHNYIRQLKPDS